VAAAPINKRNDAKGGASQMGSLDGKVAFITGVARGQGRSHAVRLAEEGADIIGVDLCDQVPTVRYKMSTEADLEETEQLVAATGRRMLARKADVRDLDALKDTVAAGVERFGRLDTIIANAGILIGKYDEADSAATFRDQIDINLIGAWHTVEAGLPVLQRQGEGGSIVITSSIAGLKGAVTGAGAGTLGYAAAKHGVVGLMRKYANLLAPERIRVNTVHPTGVDTPMLAEFPAEYAEFTEQVLDKLPPGDAMRHSLGNPMPVEVIEAVDVSNAIVWLVSDAARYVTGVTLPVDAGFINR
jgi:SDR family mycofactocin-dependent oxidoreductase